MNHQKVYDAIIAKIRFENRTKYSYHQRKQSNFELPYYETHHILPRCMGGGDEPENLMLVTLKEHFVCHKLLLYIFKKNRGMVSTFHFMTITKRYESVTSARDYEYARLLFINTPISEETRQKLIDNHHDVKGENNPMHNKILYNVWIEKYGIDVANQKYEAMIKKMSKSLKGKKHTEEQNKNQSIRQKGNKPNPYKGVTLEEQMIKKYGVEEGIKRTKSIKENLKIKNTGKKASDETIKKLKKSHLGQKPWNTGKKIKDSFIEKHGEIEGSKLYENYKNRIGKSTKGKPAHIRGRKAIIKGDKKKYVKLEDLNTYLSDGWHLLAKEKKIKVNKEDRIISEETRKKWRDSKLGEKNPAKRPEVKLKMSKSHIGKEPWNKDLRGIKSNIKGRKAVCKDGIRKYVEVNEIIDYINDGWQLSKYSK